MQLQVSNAIKTCNLELSIWIKLNLLGMPFQIEMKYRAFVKNFKIVEVPIILLIEQRTIKNEW